MLSDPDILEALRACYATPPAHRLAVNIVDLGLVESITLTPDLEAPGANIPGVPQKSSLTLTVLTLSANEDAEAQLQAQIANRLAGLEAVSHTTVTLLKEPAWTPLDITPSGRKTLGLDGNPNLVQIR